MRMQLCIKQRAISWKDTFDVYAKGGSVKYIVTADFLSLFHRLRVYDKKSNREVGSVHEKSSTWLPAYNIVIDGNHVGTVARKFRLFAHDYQVNFQDWRVEGDFLGWDFRVYQEEKQIMTISKEWTSWGDTYIMKYDDPKVEIPGLLLVLAIDAACSNK